MGGGGLGYSAPVVPVRTYDFTPEEEDELELLEMDANSLEEKIDEAEAFRLALQHRRFVGRETLPPAAMGRLLHAMYTAHVAIETHTVERNAVIARIEMIYGVAQARQAPGFAAI